MIPDFNVKAPETEAKENDSGSIEIEKLKQNYALLFDKVCKTLNDKLK